jgi:hypothetical protein
MVGTGSVGAEQQSPVTGTGTRLRGVAALPSAPVVLRPQQYASPPVVTPHVNSTPASIVRNVRPPATATGAGESMRSLLPSSPSLLSPQQYARSPVVSAHV